MSKKNMYGKAENILSQAFRTTFENFSLTIRHRYHNRRFWWSKKDLNLQIPAFEAVAYAVRLHPDMYDSYFFSPRFTPRESSREPNLYSVFLCYAFQRATYRPTPAVVSSSNLQG